jgi:hypothetical protein
VVKYRGCRRSAGTGIAEFLSGSALSSPAAGVIRKENVRNKEVRRCAGIVLWTAGFFVFRARGMYRVGRACKQLRVANYPVANCLGEGVINVHKKASNELRYMNVGTTLLKTFMSIMCLSLISATRSNVNVVKMQIIVNLKK